MKTKKKSNKQIKNHNRVVAAILSFPLVFFLSLAVIGGVFLFRAYAAPKSPVTLSVDPGSKTVSKGQTIKAAIRLNTGSQHVNAVQANLTYPADKFDFVSIDSKGSAFAIEAQSKGGNGKIEIARGSIASVKSSNVLIAYVNLRAKSSGKKLSVAFTNGTVVVSSQTNLNILQKKNNGTFVIK